MPRDRTTGSTSAVTTLDAGGRQVRVSHPERVMYPESGMTKSEVVAYFSGVAPALLAQLHDRPVTRVRFPHGVGGERFFEKNVPRGAPDWLRHRLLHAAPGGPDEGTLVDLPFLDDVAGLVWAANLGVLELHTPQWTVGPRGGVRRPDRLVIDLDPGPPAGLAACASVARTVAERLRADGLDPRPVTSGSKGLQLYARLDGRRPVMQVWAYARDLAHELAAADPDHVVAVMRKELRYDRVFLDWSQNHPAKTTITPYSLRGRALPTVAAPRTWAELDDPDLRQLSAQEVLARLDDVGDLLGGG
jgi:bifunctional non-homologous end joining protein LigD